MCLIFFTIIRSIIDKHAQLFYLYEFDNNIIIAAREPRDLLMF